MTRTNQTYRFIHDLDQSKLLVRHPDAAWYWRDSGITSTLPPRDAEIAMLAKYNQMKGS